MRTLLFENLEKRKMLAGDVSVFVDGTTLHVEGDHERNGLRISENAGDLVFEPVGDTTVNGQPIALTVPKEGIDLLMARYGAGDDSMVLTDVNFPGDVVVEMLSGGGPGSFNSPLAIAGSSIGGNLSVIGNDGGEVVSLTFSVVKGDLSIDLGAGTDSVSMRGVQIFGSCQIDTGSNGASGSVETVVIRDVAVGSGDLTILTAQGDDVVTLFGSLSVAGDLRIDGEQGNDDALLTNLTSGSVGGTIVIEGFEAVWP